MNDEQSGKWRTSTRSSGAAENSGARAPRDPLIRDQRSSLAAMTARWSTSTTRRGRAKRSCTSFVDGTATFEVDGETIEAPQGTLLYVGADAQRKATGNATILAMGGTPGEVYQAVDWGEAWPFHRESMQAYGEQRYADAFEAVRNALALMPDHAGLNYNAACFATLAGDTERRDLRPSPTVRRAPAAVPRRRAPRRRLRRRARRPAVRAGPSLAAASVTETRLRLRADLDEEPQLCRLPK